mmetsp:Transcript_2331/g.3653  ORF Transcript_2331/g.3653 Transcript_2331/m.3653 type:complete len:80 (-) Transcript_2331:376-615(-)
MRTYDIAAIRTGARPVYANYQMDDKTGDGVVEIVWHFLDPVKWIRSKARLMFPMMYQTQRRGDGFSQSKNGKRKRTSLF